MIMPESAIEHDGNRCDERSPLIPGEQISAQKPTPLPWLQLTILLFLQLAEPITSHCILPFINQVRFKHTAI